MNKDTFCPYPFSTIFLGADGGIKPCCSARGVLGNINESDITDILTNSISKELKTKILNNEWHPMCAQCKELESIGARTERSEAYYKYDDFENINNETLVLKKIDIRWTNTCNLSCNYCYPFFSSRWANILGETVNENKKEAEEKVFEFLTEHRNTIECINLLGGEPLLQKQNKKLFDMFPNTNYYVLTNLALDIEENVIAKNLFKMPNVEWGISFETVGNKFEYVRHGAEWNKFVKNLHILKNNAKMINAHPLYCTYTALNLIEYYEFISSQDLFDGIFWASIGNVKGLNVSNMDREFKIKAIKEIELLEKMFPNAQGVDHLLQIKNNLEENIDNIPAIDGKKHFIKWSNELEGKYLTDKEFSFKDLWPDLF